MPADVFRQSVADLRVGEHLCCLYETDEEHRAVLAPFLRQGLERGEKVLCVANSRMGESIRGFWREDSAALDSSLASGQFQIFTPSDSDPAAMLALLPTETPKALAQGYSALRLIGEMTWIRAELSARLLEFEAKLNEALTGTACLVFCLYDRHRFDPTLLLDALHTHPLVATGAQIVQNHYYVSPAIFLQNQPAARLQQWIQALLERQHTLVEFRTLAARLQSVREEERIALAREFHDQLGQALTGLKMDLAWVGKRLRKDQGALKEKAQSGLRLIDITIQAVRRISTQLRPGVLDELGLVAAIEWQAKEFQSRTGIQCRFTSQHEDVQLAPDRATALFRILQEALTNIARHSQASEVEIRLGADARDLILELKDNGIGFIVGEKPSTQSLGLLGMRERALALRGEVQVRSVAGAGTTVTARIPVADGDPAGAHP